MPDKPAQLSEEAVEMLFRKAAAGDAQAKQDIINRHVVNFVCLIRRTRTRRTQSICGTDDILQQVRIKVHLYRFQDKHFASHTSLAAYLNKVALRQVLQEERKQRRRPKVKSLSSLTPAESQQLKDAGPAPFAAQATEEEWQRVLAQLKTPGQRAIAGLLRLGAPAHEIIDQLNTSEWTIRRTADAIETVLEPVCV